MSRSRTGRPASAERDALPPLPNVRPTSSSRMSIISATNISTRRKLPSEHVVVFDEAQRAWNRDDDRRFHAQEARPGRVRPVRTGVPAVGHGSPPRLVRRRLPDRRGAGDQPRRGRYRRMGARVAGRAARIGRFICRRICSRTARASMPALRWHLTHRVPAPDPALHLAVSVRSFRAETRIGVCRGAARR